MLNLIEKWNEVEKQGGKSMNLSIRVVLNEQNFTLIEGVQALMNEREWTFSKTSLHLMSLGTNETGSWDWEKGK